MLELLFFTGDYCPACKAMEPMIRLLEETYNDKLSISQLDVTIEPENTSIYAITSIPTLIFKKGNSVIQRFVGPQIKSKLIKIIEENING